MAQDFRHFKAGPDPAGHTWQVDFLWLQTAVSIRHSDSIDVKFLLSNPEAQIERVVSIRHPDLLDLSRKSGHPLTDPWCMALAARHLINMIETGEDFEKTLVTVVPEELAKYAAMNGA